MTWRLTLTDNFSAPKTLATATTLTSLTGCARVGIMAFRGVWVARTTRPALLAMTRRKTNCSRPATRRFKSKLFTTTQDFPPPPAVFSPPIKNLGPDANTYRDSQTGEVVDATTVRATLSTFSPHRSPLGLSFDTGSRLPEPFRQDGFIVSWNPGSEANGTALGESQDLLWLELSQTSDTYEARVTRLARGFQLPVDTALLGTTLYVLEYGSNAKIWQITFE